MAPLFRISLFGLVAVPLVSAVGVRSFDAVRKDAAEDIIPEAYIVEFGDPASIINFRKYTTPYAEFYDHLNKRGVLYTTTKEWCVSGVFHGVSIRVDKDVDMSQLVNAPGVRSIQPVRSYKRPEPVNTSEPEAHDTNASPHIPTGVDALHRAGVLGGGVTVAIIDTGVDYNHTVLGGGFGAGRKVLGGYDFVGDDFNGFNTAMPDADPMDCNGHGTHVAGIVAASGPNPYNLTGVAPQANLRAYRIFGCQGTTTDDIVIDALLLAYTDNVDVINLSLGGPTGWTISPTSVVASRLAEMGIVVTIAAGNDGNQGPWWPTSPGSGVSVITVASTDSFPQDPASALLNPEGGIVSSFTSYGPTYDLFLKPNVAAPGGNILSSIPHNQYAVLSGTSMAAPYVAGSAALILSTKRKNDRNGRGVKKHLQTTAKYIGSTHTETDPYNTLIQQGSGLVQVFNAIHYLTKVSPSEIMLNDTTHWNGVRNVEIENTSSKSVTYTLSHTPAGTAITYNGILPTSTVALTTSSLNVTFSRRKVTVRPKSKRRIVVTFDKPENNMTLPVYSGWVTITASTGEVLSVPYMGVAAAMRDVQVIDNSNTYFGFNTPAILDLFGDLQSEPTNYTFIGSDYPVLEWRRAAGTARQVVDLVSADINLKPTYEKRAEWEEFGKRSWGSSWFPWWKPSDGGTYAKVPVVGTLLEEKWVYRHAMMGVAGIDYEPLEWSSPLFANGTTVPQGSYRFLLRVLKITGNPSREEDYETYLSPVVGFYPDA